MRVWAISVPFPMLWCKCKIAMYVKWRMKCINMFNEILRKTIASYHPTHMKVICALSCIISNVSIHVNLCTQANALKFSKLKKFWKKFFYSLQNKAITILCGVYCYMVKEETTYLGSNFSFTTTKGWVQYHENIHTFKNDQVKPLKTLLKHHAIYCFKRFRVTVMLLRIRCRCIISGFK